MKLSTGAKLGKSPTNSRNFCPDPSTNEKLKSSTDYIKLGGNNVSSFQVENLETEGLNNPHTGEQEM